MDDLISRQSAIDAILSVTGNSSVRELYEHVQEHGLSDMWSGGVSAAIDIIIAVPSAQSEPCEDTISRKEAIDAFYKHPNINWTTLDVLAKINALPSTQPEIIRCKDCRHNHDCDIQYHAQAGEEFYCGVAERRIDGKNQN